MLEQWLSVQDMIGVAILIGILIKWIQFYMDW